MCFMWSFFNQILKFVSSAVTICNMNLVKRSIVEQYAKNSVEYSIVHDICYSKQNKKLKAKETDDDKYVEVLENVRM